jgi:hypothetical protein
MEDANSRAGIVYVLSNEAMPGMVKIGRTSGESASKRVADLSRATGVPLPFKVEAARSVYDAVAVERAFHVAFGPYRVNPAREFFAIDVAQAAAIINVFPGDDVTPQTERAVEQEVEQQDPGSLAAVKRFAGKRRPPLNFTEMGIPIGATLTHSASGEVALVVEPKKIAFREEVMSLTAAQRIVSGAEYDVQPGGHWSFDGETVNSIYERTYPRGTSS